MQTRYNVIDIERKKFEVAQDIIRIIREGDEHEKNTK